MVRTHQLCGGVSDLRNLVLSQRKGSRVDVGLEVVTVIEIT